MRKKAMSLPTSLELLMREHGYRMDGRSLICVGMRGFTSDTTIGQFATVFAAAEYLIPIIRQDSYSTRLRRITCPADY